MGINWDELSDWAPDFDGILLGRFEDGNEDCDDCWVTLMGLENRPPVDDCCPLPALADDEPDCGKSFGFLAGGIPAAWLCARTTLGFGGGAAGVDFSSPSEETTNFWGPLGFEPAQITTSLMCVYDNHVTYLTRKGLQVVRDLEFNNFTPSLWEYWFNSYLFAWPSVVTACYSSSTWSLALWSNRSSFNLWPFLPAHQQCPTSFRLWV